MNSAEVVASRFNDISLQVDRVAEDAEAEFRAAVDELNALSEQLLVVNKQLNRKASVDQQPPGLLDQRDAMLRYGVIDEDWGNGITKWTGVGQLRWIRSRLRICDAY